MGGFIYNKTDDIHFGFNRTYDRHSNGTRTGLVVSNSFLSGREMFELSLSLNLTAHLDRDFKNQELTFTAFSDFNSYNFTINLYNY